MVNVIYTIVFIYLSVCACLILSGLALKLGVSNNIVSPICLIGIITSVIYWIKHHN